MYAALGGESAQVLDGVTSLLDKHLLYQAGQDSPGQDDRRLLMLETIREYGLEALAESQEMESGPTGAHSVLPAPGRGGRSAPIRSRAGALVRSAGAGVCQHARRTELGGGASGK